MEFIPKVTVSTNRASTVKGDVLIIPVFEGGQLASELSPAATRELKQKMRGVHFDGKWASADLLIAPKSLHVEFVGVVGVGPRDANFARQVEGMRRGVGRIVHEARRHVARNAFAILPTENTEAFASAMTEAAYLANYRYTTFRSKLKQEQEHRSLKKLTLLTEGSPSAVREAVKETQTILDGVLLARDLVNDPASHAHPSSLVDAAKNITKENKGIELTVLDKKQAEKQGFNAFLAVARGSVQEPYVIHLAHKPKGATRRIVLVGKGITFDSGGLSLKPAQHMSDMKIDMAGAAAVLGVFSVITKLNIPVEVHGVIASCENMPSGSAYRPGDVVTAMNGKTIEIQNTDAEGRVTMADTLSYANKLHPDAIIDLATLTGACIVGLGESYAGLMGNSESLQQQLLAAAQQSGEGLAVLPLAEEYRPFIQSSVADVTNSATKTNYGGAITAALFLHEFVGDTPWAHLDIAGPAYADKMILSYNTPGATGYGVRTLVEYLRNTAA